MFLSEGIPQWRIQDFNLEGHEFIFNFGDFFSKLWCTIGRKSPTILSKHHRKPLVSMFQTYATCV